MTAFKPDRRKFLKLGASVVGAGLVLGINWSCTEPSDNPTPETDAFSPNAWLRIDKDGSVTVMVAESEMGQGPYTALPMILAEELEVAWPRIRVEHAPLDPVYGYQITGGSTSVSNGWLTMREAGAIAREMLLRAAAETWKVPSGECQAMQGKVMHPASGRSLDYGPLAARAASQPIPDKVRLKDPAEFRIIGKPIPRVDTAEKINGRAKFGIDIKLPGMVYATIAHCPVFGGEVKSIDTVKTRQVAGVLDVFAIDAGVVVVAEDTWSAFKGKAALRVEWDYGDHQGLSSDALIDELRARRSDRSTLVQSRGKPLEMLGVNPVESVYTLPFQAHVPMEPMNCTASYEDGKLRVWAPTQSPSRAYQSARLATRSGLGQVAARLKQKLFDSRDDSIEINTTLLGGGFGRRLQQDYVSEATQIARQLEKPV
jgi:isoquinoline 1-oxidoreductase subunit beta